MSVTLSAGTRSSLLALQQISALMALSQARLATGKRVNSALDDPNNFFTASALNSRASQLNQLVDTAAGAQKTIEAAANGINAIEALIRSAQTAANDQNTLELLLGPPKPAANDALQSTATNAKVTGTVTGLTGASSITTSVNKTITVNDGTTTATYTADLSPTVQEFLDAVNNTSG